MPTINRREIQVERKTYLRGRFVAKLNGDIDYESSDLIRENFFNLEYLSADIFANFSDLKKWQDGDEYEEFALTKRFFPEIQRPIDCHLTYDDGTVKHFKVALFDPKLNTITLDKQVYEKGVVFVTLSAQICGYLRHFETEVIEEVIEDVMEEIVEDAIPDSTLGDTALPESGVSNINVDRQTRAPKDPIEQPAEPRTMIGRTFNSDTASDSWPRFGATKRYAQQYFPRTSNWLGKQYYERRSARMARRWVLNMFPTPVSGCFFTLLGAIILMYLVIGIWMVLYPLVGILFTRAGSALAQIAIYLLLFCALYFALKKTRGFGAWMIRIIILLLIVGMISRC